MGGVPIPGGAQGFKFWMWLSAHTWGMLTVWIPSPGGLFTLGFAGLTDQTQHKGHSLCFSKLLGAFLLRHKSLKTKPQAPFWSISCLLREPHRASRAAQLLPSPYSVLHQHRNLFAAGDIPTTLSFHYSDKNTPFPAHQVSFPALTIPVLLSHRSARVVFPSLGCSSLWLHSFNFQSKWPTAAVSI